MQDRQLYAQILGIEDPWRVERVELQLEGREVHVYLTHTLSAQWHCAECNAPVLLYDHQAERVWRHLDTCQYRTLLHAAPPRTACPTHGVRVAKLPWAAPSSRFTVWSERMAIDWLKVASQAAVAAQLGLSWEVVGRDPRHPGSRRTSRVGTASYCTRSCAGLYLLIHGQNEPSVAA